jgi:uncharacterized membrane protein SirB2
MYTGLLHTHKLVVTIFLIIYLIKMVLQLMNKREKLDTFRRYTKVPEMIVASLFLVTGIWMIILNPVVSVFQYIKFVAVLAAIPFGVIGFNKGKKAFGVLSFVMILMAYGLAEMGKKRVKAEAISSEIITNPEAEGYDKIAHGGAIYNVQCMRCHGSDGNLGAAGAYKLGTSVIDKESLVQVIRYGKGHMPGFDKVLNETEIDAVAEFTEQLRK